MGGKEMIPFTVKGPIPLQLIDSGGEQGKKQPGCAVMDLCFQNPSQVGELILSNYYTAWISIYVKRAAGKGSTHHLGSKAPSSGTMARSRPHFERSISVDLSGEDLKSRSSTSTTYEHGASGSNLFALEDLQSSTAGGNGSGSRRRHSSGPNSAESLDRPWECCVTMKTLMPWPHFEAGCQDTFSIAATESLVELRDVVALRFVLHQPSTVWKRFALEDIQAFRNLPKRGCMQNDDFCRQREGWLATLRINTKKMLGGQLVEPEKYESDAEC